MSSFLKDQHFRIVIGGFWSSMAAFYVILTSLLTSSGRAVLVTSMTNESLTEIPNNISVESTTIVLSYNEITLCENDTFSRFSKLQILYLDHNAILTIESVAFNGTVLQELYLDHNRLTSVPQFIGIGDSLTILDLSWNSLEAADLGDILQLTSLKDFRLSANPLASFDASDCQIRSENRSYCTHRLEILYFQDLVTEVVSSANFSGFSNLVTLYLDRTGLTSFDDISNVLVLNETLDMLSLTENRIVFIPEDVLHSLGALSSLILEKNRIKTFDEVFGCVSNSKRTGSLLRVYLYDNPTVCNCVWSWLLDATYVVETPDTGKLITISKGLIIYINYRLCEVGGPQMLVDYNWRNLTQELLCPPTTTQEYVSTTVMAVTNKDVMTTTDAPVTSPSQSTTSTSSTSTSPSPTTEGAAVETTEVQTTSSSVEMTTRVNKETIRLSWNTWIAWSECTSSCGGGYQYSLKVCDVINMTANCSTPLKRGEEVVLYYSVSQQTCNTEKCPIDGYWVTWSNWSECSATCGTGTTTRIRMCVGPEYGGEQCDGYDHENDVCIMDDCVDKPVEPVDLHDGEYYLEADRRPAAVGIGVISMILLGFELAVVLILDIHTIIMACKQLRRRNCIKNCKKKVNPKSFVD